MTLDGAMPIIVRHFNEVGTFGGQLTMVVSWPILSIKIVAPRIWTWQYMIYDIYLFIYLFKINDRRTRGPLILPEVHKNTQNTQHKLNKGKKQTNKHK